MRTSSKKSKVKNLLDTITHDTIKDIDQLAKKLKISKEQAIKLVLVTLCKITKCIGKHGHIPDSKFDQKQLKLGIKTELEHTTDTELAKLIAKDHLVEMPDYYTRLIKMESYL